MISYDNIALHRRLKKLEEAAGETAEQQQEEQAPSAAQQISEILRQERDSAELDQALANEDSEDGARRTAARIQLAINETQS